MPGRKRGERVLGPYRHGNGWRVVRIEANGSRGRRTFPTKRKAEIYAELVRQQLVAGDYTTDTALDAYEDHLIHVKGNKPGSVARTRWSVARFFPQPVALWALSPGKCKERYEAISAELSTDSHRNALAEVKTFLNWCVERGMLGSGMLGKNPAVDLKGTGRRSKRKAQLRIKEARRWFAVAYQEAQRGDDGALAALMALVLGMRAGEIVASRVRDLDEDEAPGDTLWIPDSKTEAGRRTLEVPELLRPLLLEQAKAKRPDAFLFGVGVSGRHWRDWPRHQVARLCDAAGVPKVTAHGMRGVLATLTIERGAAGHLVAQMLGHEDERTTMDSYAQPGSADTGARARGLAKLLPFPEQDDGTKKKSGTEGR